MNKKDNTVPDLINEISGKLEDLETCIFEESGAATLKEVPLEDEEFLQRIPDLHSLKKKVSDIYSEYQDIVSSNVGLVTQPVQVNGATVEIKNGSSRKTWAHKDLAADVSRRIVQRSVDIDTGEVTKSAEEMMQEMVGFMGVSYWKVTELKKIAIDADEYCEVSAPKKSVVIRRSE